MRFIVEAPRIYTGTENSIRRHNALYVQNGSIAAIGPAAQIKAAYPGVPVRFRRQWLLLPAFINAHDHGRGVSPFAFGAPDSSLELWIPQLGRVLADPYTAALYDGLQLLRSGVSTVMHCHNASSWEHMERELIDTARGYQHAGIRAVLCPPYVDQNALIYHERQGFIQQLAPALRHEFLGLLCDKPLTLDAYFSIIEHLQSACPYAQIQLHPVGGQWCSDETLCAMREYALLHGLRIHMHLNETKYQRAYALKRWGCSMVQHLHDLDFLGPYLSLAHMVHTEPTDIPLLKQSGTHIVCNPSSNMRLKSGTAPLQKYLEAGLPCGLGLDGCSFDDDEDYLREMRAAMHVSAVTGVMAGIAPLDIVRMATQHGAALTGAGTGQLSVGSPADFVLIDYEKLCAPYAQRDIDPIALLLQRGTKHMVDCVFLNGECLVKTGRTQRMPLQDAARMLKAALLAKARARQHVYAPSDALLAAIQAFYKTWEETS